MLCLKGKIKIIILVVFVVSGVLAEAKFIDLSERSLIPVRRPKTHYYGSPFSDGLARVVSTETAKWTFIDINGKRAFTNEFEDVSSFSEGLASFKDDEGYGFINRNGKVVVRIDCDELKSIVSGRSAFLEDGKWGFVNRAGRKIIPATFDYAQSFSEGMASVTKDDLEGFIDVEGNVVVPCKYEDTGEYSERLAAVKIGKYWGYIDHGGIFVIPAKYDLASPFSCGRAHVTLQGVNAVIDLTGEIVFKGRNLRTGCFTDGRIVFVNERRECPYGFLDRFGKVVGKESFNLALPFSEGLARVFIEGMWGAVDTSGNMVIGAKFFAMDAMSNDRILVIQKENGCVTWGYIDEQGMWIYKREGDGDGVSRMGSDGVTNGVTH